MKKNRGYVLFETLVVSTVILGTLIFLYIQLSAIKTSYERSFSYNTIPSLYKTNTLVSYLYSTGYEDLVTNLESSTNGYLDITNCPYGGSLCNDIKSYIGAKTILFTNSNLISIREHIDEANYSNSFKNFIKKINIVKNHKYAVLVEFNDKTFTIVTFGENI